VLACGADERRCRGGKDNLCLETINTNIYSHIEEIDKGHRSFRSMIATLDLLCPYFESGAKELPGLTLRREAGDFPFCSLPPDASASQATRALLPPARVARPLRIARLARRVQNICAHCIHQVLELREAPRGIWYSYAHSTRPGINTSSLYDRH
jgi:hypothetical protein